MHKYLLAYRAYHTKKAYSTATKRYLRYIQQHEPAGKQAFPASDGTLARFVSRLADEGISYITIKGYLSGIRSAHLERGLPWKELSKRFTLWATLQGIKRVVGCQAKPKMAITLHKLRKFAPAWHALRESNKQKVLWGATWAAMLTGFFAMLRKDNLTEGKRESTKQRAGLRRDDVQFQEPRKGRPAVAWLRIRYSKTVQYKERVHYVPLVATGGDLCPVRALRAHIAETTQGPKDPLFQVPAKRRGTFRALTYAELVKGIKTLAGAAGYDPKQFASHSLRRGGATLAFRMGAPVQQIQLQGDWLSDAVYRYQQVHLADRLALPTRMAAMAATRG